MKMNFLSKLDTTKKKAGAIVVSTALIAALGTGTAFAANSINFLQVKTENGVKSYSTDGQTWSETAPDGVTISDVEGKLTITNGTLPKDGEGHGLLSKLEDGVVYFSTDGGETWSETAPDGVTVSDVEGKLTITNGTLPKDGEGHGLLSKVEDGVVYFSTDGGETWSDDAPADVKISDNDGKFTITKGALPTDAEGKGTLSKIEDGVMYFSVDGGKTWSKEAPTFSGNNGNPAKTKGASINDEIDEKYIKVKDGK